MCLMHDSYSLEGNTQFWNLSSRKEYKIMNIKRDTKVNGTIKNLQTLESFKYYIKSKSRKITVF